MKYKNSIFILCLTIFTMTTFQNCGQPQHNSENQKISSVADNSLSLFFAYPYTSAPNFYADLFMFVPENQTANISNLKFLATVSYPANPTANIQYTIVIQDPNGLTVCPTQTGSLSSGVTSFEFDCVSMRSTSEVHAKMTINSSGFQEVFNKKFR